MGLEKYDELKGIGWDWQSGDGCMAKAPLAREAVGPNPTDRGKMGAKRSLSVDKSGLPLSVVSDRANRHDIKLPEATLDGMVIVRPELTPEQPQNISLGAAYVGSEELLKERGYIIHIRPCGEEKKELVRNLDFRARRRVMEVTHSFMNHFRKLPVRYEKKTGNYLTLIEFA